MYVSTCISVRSRARVCVCEQLTHECQIPEILTFRSCKTSEDVAVGGRWGGSNPQIEGKINASLSRPGNLLCSENETRPYLKVRTAGTTLIPSGEASRSSACESRQSGNT